MSHHRRDRLLISILACLALVVSTLVGCDVPFGRSDRPSSRPTTLPPSTPTPGEVIRQSTPPATTPTPSSSRRPVRSLVWWTPEDHAPGPFSDSPAAQVLQEQLQAFSQQTGEPNVHVVLKKPFGKGGILDFLRTASAAAPSVLPDLVTIHSDELAIAARAGLLHPLDSLVSDEIRNDLFPFAQQAGQIGDELFGLQWDADVEHMAYDSRVIATPPKTWEELLSSQVTYAIPGAMEEGRVNDHFLIQYLGAGGRFDPAADPPVDALALRRVLEFLATARQSDRIPELVLALPDTSACWAALLDGEVQMAQVRASQFMSTRPQAGWVRYATTPTWDGRTVTISHGWMLAITAREPERREAAARLIAWLLQPEHMGTWTLASHRLPTRRAALALWDEEDPYVSFVRWQLEAAQPRPHYEAFTAISRALQWAEREVITGRTTPEQAVTEVLAEITP
ncbi:MAG: extracellular solute-binding protein [Chloroflexi bacterium]|nr:extracellular solute-binding protein [Chloroflexota bacterium]